MYNVTASLSFVMIAIFLGGTTVPNSKKSTPHEKVVILPLFGVGTNEITEKLDDYLRKSVEMIDGTDLLSDIDVRMAIEGSSPKDALSQCNAGVKCALKIGRLVGADIVIIGSVTGFGNSFGLSVRALDVQQKKERSRYNVTVLGRDKLIPQIRLAAYSLVSPNQIEGWLLLDSDLAGASVRIDGKEVGITPLRDPLSATPGNHVLVATKTGYAPMEYTFAIRPFEFTKLKITLNPSP